MLGFVKDAFQLLRSCQVLVDFALDEFFFFRIEMSCKSVYTITIENFQTLFLDDAAFVAMTHCAEKERGIPTIRCIC